MYRFRVTFSTNVDEFYKADGTDTTVSLVIAAYTFKEAETEAEEAMLDMLFSPNQFDIVSVQRVDNLGEEVVDIDRKRP